MDETNDGFEPASGSARANTYSVRSGDVRPPRDIHDNDEAKIAALLRAVGAAEFDLLQPSGEYALTRVLAEGRANQERRRRRQRAWNQAVKWIVTAIVGGVLSAVILDFWSWLKSRFI